MKFAIPLSAAACLALTIPALAGEASAIDSGQDHHPATEQTGSDPEPVPAPTPSPAPTETEAPEAQAAEEEAEERVCRRVRTDLSSRRPTRMCMTRDEWREFNQGN